MDLLQLIYFCDAARTQNFSETARKYQVPTSGVSQTIKRLETELGVSLFDRRNNKIVLNRAGGRFYNKVYESLSLLDSAVEELRDDGAREDEELKLLVYINRRLVTDAIVAFKQEHPNVSFVIHHKPEDDRELYDLVISDERSFCRDYEPRLLVREKIVLAMSREHPLAEKERILPEDLSREGFIFMNEGSSLSRKGMEICHEMQFDPRVVIRTDDPSLVRRYVSMNLGVSLIPAFSWGELLDDATVTRDIGEYQRETYVFLKKNAYRTKAALEFTQALFAQISEN